MRIFERIIKYFQFAFISISCTSQGTLHMAENVAPTSAITADATRGIPYYEKLKRDLRETLNKKRLLDKNLVNQPNHDHRAIDSSRNSL